MDSIRKIIDAIRFKSKMEIVQQQYNEIKQQIEGVQQQYNEIKQQIEGVQQQVIETRNHIAVVKKTINGLRESILALRYHTSYHSNEPLHPIAKLKETLPLCKQFKRLQQLAPHAYAIWRPLLTVNEEAYKGLPIDSCSVPGHPMATLFQFFLAPYLKGRVLDIGCGPQAVPTYLEDCPADAIYGIDPLSEPDDHPFHFVKSLAEYLPWEDSQFKLVVAATTLDHVLLLDKVLREVRRVLKEDGIFAVWVGFVPGSKPYDPYRQGIELVDNYHLFHLDREWFLDAIKPFFSIFEEFPVDLMNYFFAFRPKKSTLH